MAMCDLSDEQAERGRAAVIALKTAIVSEISESFRALRDSDGSPEGRDAKRLDGEAATARAEGIAQPQPEDNSQ
jgi:hypothetical protein